MRQLSQSVVLKWELCTKAKLSIFRPVHVPILTCGHECWVMNEKVSSRVQAVEMGFLQRISGVTLLDKVTSADIRESLVQTSNHCFSNEKDCNCVGMDVWYKCSLRKEQPQNCSVNTDWSKAWRLSQNSMARLHRSQLVSPWHPSRTSIDTVLCCRGSRCLKAPSRAAALATPQG